MQAAPIWLLWKEVWREGKPKPDKVPYYANGTPRCGTLDGPDDRARLVPHVEAVRALESNPEGYAGLAIALGPDGRGGCWQGIDLDQIVVAGLTDIADLWTRGPCAELGYVEASPSGTGLHLIGYGRTFRTLPSNHTGIEAYAGGRFFTFTGRPVVADSACRPYDLAEYVEAVLAPRHGAPKADAKPVEVITVDAGTIKDLRSALLSMRADDYDTWYRMGLALKELGDAGRGLWLDWSATSEKFDPRAASRAWDQYKPHSTGHRAVFAEAMRRGWVNPQELGDPRHGAAVADAFIERMGTTPATQAEVLAGRRLNIRSLGGVQMRAIAWLWPGWIPKGYITIVAGESGAGKSTVLADVTARVTTGAPWPGEVDAGERKPERVLWLGSEDSVEEMTVPRLMACGAVLDRVSEIQGVTHQGMRNTFSMQDDLAAVAEHLEAARLGGEPFAMLVIDPVTSYLPGQRLRRVDLNDAGQLRSILEPWLDLAQSYNIAIVCVTHFAKDSTRPMLHRVIGSQAFAATCRSLCAVIEPPTVDDDEPDPFEKAMVQVKVNLPEHPGGAWRFFTERVEVGIDTLNGLPIFATRPDWADLDTGLTPKTAVGGRRGPKSDKAPAFGLWLSEKFAAMEPGAWVPIEHVKWHAIQDVGLSKRWWDKHSGDFLEKTNTNGTWMCRLASAPNNTGESG